MAYIVVPRNRSHSVQFAAFRGPVDGLETLSHCIDERARLRWRIVRRPEHVALDVVTLAPTKGGVRVLPGHILRVPWP